jgi:PKD repeat protein
MAVLYGSGLWGETRVGIGAFYFNPETLEANFSATPLSGYHGPGGMTVTFTDLSTGSPEQWTWDFGDGTTSGERNPIHIYTTCGDFDVTLTVGKLVF